MFLGCENRTHGWMPPFLQPFTLLWSGIEPERVTILTHRIERATFQNPKTHYSNETVLGLYIFLPLPLQAPHFGEPLWS